jgi:inosine-uridine nucleoside N-ribohydrolase
MLAPVGGNISTLISPLLLQHPGTVLQIRAPSGVFIAAFATAISAVGGTAGTIVFDQGFALAAAGTSFCLSNDHGQVDVVAAGQYSWGKTVTDFVVTVTMSSTEHC